MVIPEGYKKTEIGVIPEDWECTRFGEKVKIYRGGSPRPIQNYITTASNGINWIKIGDVRENDKYINSTQEKIIPEGASRSREVHIGDFILSNSMSFGRPYILGINGCIHDGWLTIQDYSKTFSSEFLYYILSSDLVYQQYISMAAGSSVKNLNKEKVSALNVITPPVSEQQRIAEALSDIDNMITSLEKLIEKKKAIKQGAMQELLTGKKRLPGFSGEWKCLKFKETGVTILKGQTITQKEISYGSIPVIAGGKVPAYYCDKANRTGTNITISASGASAGFINIYREDIFASDCSTIGESKGYNIDFVYYVLLNTQAMIYSSQTGGAQPHIHPNDIYELKVYYTYDINEQFAIASVLSDMDSEIEALEQKLAKTRQLKQGMMQQLLTGKIRLV